MTRGAVARRYFPSRWRIKKWSNKQQIIFKNKPKLTKSILMDILSKEFKPIAFEINQLENRHTKNIIWTFCMFSSSKFQSKRYSQKIFHLRNIQKTSPSNQTLIEDFKKFFFEEVELECQDNSTPMEILPTLVNQDFKSEVKIKFHYF